MRGQLLAAYGELEQMVAATEMPANAAAFGTAEVTVAVAWAFTQMMMPEVVVAEDYPALRAFSEVAEQEQAFLDTPAV